MTPELAQTSNKGAAVSAKTAMRISCLILAHDNHLMKQPSQRDRRGSSLPCRASLVAQMVKNPPAMWESWVQSLGWEDTLENEMATYSSSFVWEIPWTEEPGWL